MNQRIFFGIDCGLDGAISAINQQGQILLASPMPTIKLGKGRQIDVQAIADILLSNPASLDNRSSSIHLAVEDPGGHAPSAAGLRSMTYSFASVHTIAVLYLIPHLIVPSQKWQPQFWPRPKMPKGQKFNTKAAALNAASRIWPGNQFLASPRCSKPHDGIVDALLIAEYSRRLLGH